MVSQFSDLNIAGTLLLVFAIVGAWTMTSWTLRGFGKNPRMGSWGPFRLVICGLLFAPIVLGAGSTLMNQGVGVLIVVGAGALMYETTKVLGLVLRSMFPVLRRSCRGVGNAGLAPVCRGSDVDDLARDQDSAAGDELRDRNCTCPHYVSWADHHVVHRPDCHLVIQQTRGTEER